VVTKFISVIIPTYNRKDILKKTLESLFKQTYPKDAYDIIVVIDGSTDGTETMIKSLIPPCELRYFKQEHHGMPVAINVGIRNARGELILLTDDDIIADPHLLQEHTAYHLESNGTAVLGYVPLSPEIKRTPLINYINHWIEHNFKQREKPGYTLSFRDFHGGNASVQKKYLLEVGGFDEDFTTYGCPDLELGYRLQKQGLTFKYNPYAIGYHYIVRNFESWCKYWYLEGRADVLFYQKHPEAKPQLRLSMYFNCPFFARMVRELLLKSTKKIDFPIQLLHQIIRGFEFFGYQKSLFLLYELANDFYYWKGALSRPIRFTLRD